MHGYPVMQVVQYSVPTCTWGPPPPPSDLLRPPSVGQFTWLFFVSIIIYVCVFYLFNFYSDYFQIKGKCFCCIFVCFVLVTSNDLRENFCLPKKNLANHFCIQIASLIRSLMTMILCCSSHSRLKNYSVRDLIFFALLQ